MPDFFCRNSQKGAYNHTVILLQVIHPQFLELNRVETYTQVYICVEFTQQDSQKKENYLEVG